MAGKKQAANVALAFLNVIFKRDACAVIALYIQVLALDLGDRFHRVALSSRCIADDAVVLASFDLECVFLPDLQGLGSFSIKEEEVGF